MITEPGQEKAGWPVVKLERSLSSNRRLPERVLDGAAACSSRAFEAERYLPESAVKGLVEALEEAVDMVHDWASYASEYFQEKHDLEGDLAKLRAALTSYTQEVE